MSSETDLRQPLVNKEEKKRLILKPVSFTSLFKYSTPSDKIYMFLGSITSLAAGAMMPMFMIFFSDIITIFIEENRENAAHEGLVIAIKFFALGGLTWFLSKSNNNIRLYWFVLLGNHWQKAKYSIQKNVL